MTSLQIDKVLNRVAVTAVLIALALFIVGSVLVLSGSPPEAGSASTEQAAEAVR
jgi:hypothetical protein